MGRGVPARCRRGVLAGAEAAGARLVVLDNLYAYGPTDGRDLVETLRRQPELDQGGDPGSDDRPSFSPPTRRPRRGRDRTGLRLLRTGHDPLGARETVFGTALTGRTAQVMGDPDLPHSYSYTPDVAAP